MKDSSKTHGPGRGPRSLWRLVVPGHGTETPSIPDHYVSKFWGLIPMKTLMTLDTSLTSSYHLFSHRSHAPHRVVDLHPSSPLYSRESSTVTLPLGLSSSVSLLRPLS